MADTAVGYVVQTPEGARRIAGSRVSLASIVRAYWEGLSPEEIMAEFFSLNAAEERISAEDKGDLREQIIKQEEMGV